MVCSLRSVFVFPLYVGTTVLVGPSVPNSRKHYSALSWAALQGSRPLSRDSSPLQIQTLGGEREREWQAERQVGEKRRSSQHWELQTTRWQCITSASAWCHQRHYRCFDNASLGWGKWEKNTCCMLNSATLIKHGRRQVTIVREEKDATALSINHTANVLYHNMFQLTENTRARVSHSYFSLVMLSFQEAALIETIT